MPLTPFDYFKKKLNFRLVNLQGTVERVLNVLSILLAVAALGLILFEHGCYLTPQQETLVTVVVTIAFIFYVLRFIVSAIFSSDIKQYFKDQRLNFVLILCTVALFAFFAIYERTATIHNQVQFYHQRIIAFHLLYFVIFFIEVVKSLAFLKKIHLSPPVLMMLSFFVLIFIGTGLLLMPKMTVHGIAFIDALFTATSASCVTGLTVLSTANDFTTSGQIVLMVLMQLGGMSILSFATFFISFLSHSVTGLRYQYMVKDMLSTDKLSDSFSFLREIIMTIFIVEGIGVVMLYMYWETTGLFETNGETFYFALFHAVSAFNNAGFSLWTDGLMDTAVVNSHFPQVIIMLLVFIGSIGFVVLRDFFAPAVIRERKRKRWKSLAMGTQIALITSFAIIIIGTILFFFIEYDNTLASKNTLFDKAFCALFQVTAGRTAGFNIVDVNAISVPMLLVVILIIFIGASPGSTGGGIKTTTAFVIIKSIFATIKGKNKIEFNKKTIPFSLVDKSYSIVVMSLVIIFITVVSLGLLEPMVPLKNIIFESTSAFTTCGLSTGCIGSFSVAGKALLTFNMYIGRIGTLTFAYALSKRTKESRHEYPETYFMVG
ncbi:MAG: hypothetical protein J5792_07665 [Bacteroidales bacterium]|nr:hypothetical protein [Bacteroidales bacterium]